MSITTLDKPPLLTSMLIDFKLNTLFSLYPPANTTLFGWTEKAQCPASSDGKSIEAIHSSFLIL